MATYAQLEAESLWNDEVEAPAHAAFNERLRAHFGLSEVACASKGDNKHLRGRHRSRNWALNSRYCTNRAYGTQDRRDKAGDGDWLRATDVGISGPQLHQACRRLDAAVRAGLLPCVAEWFGSVNGTTVVGWYEGHSSTSDSSHLWHLHIGLWTSYCDDVAQLRLLGDIITGTSASTGGTPMLGLRAGDEGDQVKTLQIMLQTSGFSPGDVDGAYGPKTSGALLALRKSIGSSATTGDTVDPWAYEQLLRVHAAAQAGKPGPKGDPGPTGPEGPEGPEGPPGRDGIGVGARVTVVGEVTQVGAPQG